MIHNFNEKLQYSRGERESTDMELLQSIIPGCKSVIKTTIEADRLGVDYIATLRNGAEIFIDAKTRTKGCSKYWKNGPELAPEIWSVMPGGKYGTHKERAKTGWTLNESLNVDYILHTFHQKDSDDLFFLPFQLYRISFRKNVKNWMARYKVDTQDSGKWQSQCVFVPAKVVVESIKNEMCRVTQLQEVWKTADLCGL